jgi:antitoxin ParD1/3/4
MIIALKGAIKEGIDSGIATDFEPAKHLAKLKPSKNKNA